MMTQATTPEQHQAAAIGEVLWHVYPGYRWAVAVVGGLARIRNLDLSGQWGFDVSLESLKNDPMLRDVIRAGGEILERYRLSRSACNADRLNELPRWLSGEAKGDTNA
ncbi:MAG: hypothetical protein HQL79_09285 [Magnetococcales bacterium]|nr:hypothetical protein [Magnetococcales bacterium]